MIFWSEGSPQTAIGPGQARDALVSALTSIGPLKRVIAVPPDCTRVHSLAGPLTEAAWEYYGEKLEDVLPATGTHSPMTDAEIGAMFGRVPPGLFRVHDWRGGTRSIGEVPAEFVKEVSEGRVHYGIPIEVDRLIAEGKHDLVLSIGQVVPHEVIGMAGHAKNIFIGAGGAEAINRTHFLGAAYGMERIMGRAETPVRQVLRYGADRFARHLPIVYVLTVVGQAGDGGLALRGLFIGDDEECFRRAAALALEVNVEILDEPLGKVVVYLDPAEFKSTWLGNKSIYRTRMAVAEGGELVVLAPGVSRFGEDPAIDGLIRKYGYAGTPKILDLTEREEDLRQNLSAAAHLIHGSSEGRFTVTYCPGRLTRPEVESVNFRFAELDEMMKRYDPRRLAEGFNTMPDGERIFYISNPALGLWAHTGRFPRGREVGA
ncbi:MAG: lactate racemase domain-containing protein [Candidatus Aminicenantales bacterium]